MGTTTLVTFADFEAMPEKECKRELFEGTVIEMPPPKLSHQRISKALAKHFAKGIDESRVWVELGYRIGDSWLIPDTSVAWPDQQESGDYLLHSPMIAVEIVSRGNDAEYIDEKTSAYLADGAGEVWVIYPKTRRMLVYTKEGVQQVTGRYETPLLPGLEISLPEILGA
jgi:Uma2 family endonuclease